MKVEEIDMKFKVDLFDQLNHMENEIDDGENVYNITEKHSKWILNLNHIENIH